MDDGQNPKSERCQMWLLMS